MSPKAKTEGTSHKFPVLEYIFRNKMEELGTAAPKIPFTYADVRRAYQALGIDRPASSSNIIIDLIRVDRGIGFRLPKSLINLGYDLRHKTGQAHGRVNYAGEFINVGVGNALHDWAIWPDSPDNTITVKQPEILKKFSRFLRRDEAALFSVIDYCDILSVAINDLANSIFRVQYPVKWQPNEIDGLYYSFFGEQSTLYPIEAKALSTEDLLYLPQIDGAHQLIEQAYPEVTVIPIGIRTIRDGMKIAILKQKRGYELVQLDRYILVKIDPPIPSWVNPNIIPRQGSNNNSQQLALEEE